jgi:hypothetical protein
VNYQILLATDDVRSTTCEKIEGHEGIISIQMYASAVPAVLHFDLRGVSSALSTTPSLPDCDAPYYFSEPIKPASYIGAVGAFLVPKYGMEKVG